MIVDGISFADHPEFFLQKGNWAVVHGYRVFIHQNVLYGARVELVGEKVHAKSIKKYASFNGTSEDFLALDRKNFIIYSRDVQRIEIDPRKSRKKVLMPDSGTLRLHMQNGEEISYVIYFASKASDLAEALKKHFSGEVYFMNDFLEDSTEEIATTQTSGPEFHREAFLTAEQELAVDPPLFEDDYQETEPNILKGVIAGLCAAVLATLLWFAIVVLTEYQLGIIAIAIGWLVAQAVVYGAGRKRGPSLQAVSVVITVFAMMFSEYFIVRHFVTLELAAEGVTGIPLFLPIGVMSELITLSIKESPATLFFWGLAVFEAYRIPGRVKGDS
jgi:hypothetical protein